MGKSNFYHNYPLLTEWLHAEGLDYEEFSAGQHLRVYGAMRQVDIWPGRMTYHILNSEDLPHSSYNGWNQLNRDFDPQEVNHILNEGLEQ